jgi:hypothetical protein
MILPQFFDGKLSPVETLKLIEMVSQEEAARMERGFNTYIECSKIGKGKNYFYRIFDI